MDQAGRSLEASRMAGRVRNRHGVDQLATFLQRLIELFIVCTPQVDECDTVTFTKPQEQRDQRLPTVPSVSPRRVRQGDQNP